MLESSASSAGEPPAPIRRRRRLRRIAFLLLLLVVGLPLLALVGAAVSLRSLAVRRAVLGRVAGYLEREMGLAFSAADFDLRWRGLALDGVRVGAPGAPPLLVADRVEAGIDFGTVRDVVLVVRSLEVLGARLDLAAPLPELPETEPGAGPGFEIRRLALRRGSIAGAPPTGEAAQWLSAWRAEGIEARGSFAGGLWDVVIDTARAHVERPGFAPLALGLEGRVRYRDGRPLEVPSLRVKGDGVALSAWGSVGLGDGQATAVEVEAEAEPRLLAAGAPAGGRVRARGAVRMPEASGRVALTAEAVPAEALQPFLDAALFDDLSLAGTTADARADLALGPGHLARVAGEAYATWRRADRRLAVVTVEVGPGAVESQAVHGAAAGPNAPAPAATPETAGIRLSADGHLFPDSPGRRHAQGTITAPTWSELAAGSAETIEAEVRAPDLRAAWDELRGLWPRRVPEPPPGVPLQGALGAELRLTGRLAAPRGELTADWTPAPGSRVAVRAAGEPLAASGSATIELTSFPLALLEPLTAGSSAAADHTPWSGALGGRIDLEGSIDAARAVVEIAATEVAAAPWLAGAREITAAADLAIAPRTRSVKGRARLAAGELAAAAGAGRPISATQVEVTLDGVLVSEPALSYLGKLQVEAKGIRAAVPVAAAPGEAPGGTSPGAASSRALRLGRAWIETDGRLDLAPLAWSGRFALEGDGLDVPGTVCAEEIRASGEADVAGAAAGWSGNARLAIARAEVLAAGAAKAGEDATAEATPFVVDSLSFEADMSSGELRLPARAAAAAGRRLSGSGRFTVEPLLAEADFDLRLAGWSPAAGPSHPGPLDALREVELTAALREGTLRLSAPRIATAAGDGSLRATVPLGALRALPEAAAALDALPLTPAAGPVTLRLHAPALDSAPLLATLGLADRPERVRAGVFADLTFDPASPAAGRGEVRLDGLTIETPEAAATAEGPVVARLADGRVEILPARIGFARGAAAGTALELRGGADLDASWRPAEDPPAALVSRLAFDAAGTLDAALLNPYLEGGFGSGALSVTASASGPPEAFNAEVQLDGPGASFFWPAPYATRIEAPAALVSVAAGRWTIDRARAVWNGGTLAVAGGGGGGGAGAEPAGSALAFDLAGVRYRLDYGLSALLSGRLTLDLPAEGRSRLAGRLSLDRAILDRDLSLDREVRDVLLAPDDLPGAEESALAALDLDLAVSTADGVRIRNNAADLRAWWQRLDVTGTAEEPIVRGRIELDPGGLVFAYGQTVRIDRGALVFTGDPLTDPRIELSTTSSLQDPEIARLRGDASPLAALDRDTTRYAWEERTAGPEAALTAGLAGYYGARVVSQLGAAVGLERLTVLPVLVFGEADPSARLDVGHDLSRHAALAVSIDLRNAERRTYLLDLHGFRELPGLALRGFVNDEGREGASLQQVLALGGSRPPEAVGPRLRRLRLEGVGGLRRRLLRRVVPLARGKPVPESAAFDVEVVLAEALRRRGHPDARIAVEVTPVQEGKNRVDVKVRIDPGPEVEFVFAGDRPPLAVRPDITALYRADFYEPASIEEMKAETVRALRSRGHLEPRVEVEVALHPQGGARTVTLRSEAGPRAGLRELVFPALDAETAAAAARRFAGTLARSELAAGTPGADRRLLDTLRSLGYPAPRITGRALERGGDRLVVEVDPGERQVVAAVALEGVEDEAERRRLAALLPFAPGDPLRLDRIVEGALAIERALADLGHADATVRPRLSPASLEPAAGVDVRLAVAPGPRLALGRVEFAGERSSRAERLDRIAGLEPGGPFTLAAVEEARAQLFRSGVFARVTAHVEREGDDEATVRFALAERPRFRLGYGIRWESGRGESAVLDAVDANFLGRGMTLGLRALYEPDDESGRLFLRTGAFTRGGIALELYGQGRRRLVEENLLEDSVESALQLARPFGRRTTGRLYLRHRTTRLYEEEPDPFFPLDIEIANPLAGVQLLYDALDDPLDPTRGHFASFDLSGSGPWIGGDFDYARTFGQLQLYRRGVLGGRPFVWAQSLRLGWARAFGGQELLRFERFFAGGEHSVRGYASESLGPQEALGQLVRPLGGEALLVVNQELRLPLPWDLTGVAFLDAGQVWDDPGDLGSGLATAAGLGLRARTPIGLLRLDAAFPFDRRPQDESWRLYAGFGNAF